MLYMLKQNIYGRKAGDMLEFSKKYKDGCSFYKDGNGKSVYLYDFRVVLIGKI